MKTWIKAGIGALIVLFMASGVLGFIIYIIEHSE